MAFRVVVGLDYNGKRAEPGDIVKDLPEKSVPWLLAQGAIERTKPASNEEIEVVE